MGLFSRRDLTQEELIKKMKDAIGENEVWRVRAAIDKGASVNMMGDFSPLYEAIKSNRVEIVKYLMEEGADPNVLIGENTSPFNRAMGLWRNDIVDYMLEKGFDPNLKHRDGTTLLSRAFANLYSSRIEKFIRLGADVNIPDMEGDWPIHAAIDKSSVDLMRLVIERGADINQRDKDGRTPLHRAISRSGRNDLVLALLEMGADPTIADKDNKTPAALAVEEGHVALAAVIRGEDLTARGREAVDEDGWALLGPDEVAHVTPKSKVGYRMTEIFNFSARTYTQVMRNLDTGSESLMVKSFYSVAEGDLISKAQEALVRLGGNPPEHGFAKKKLPGPGGMGA